MKKILNPRYFLTNWDEKFSNTDYDDYRAQIDVKI